MPFPVSAAVQPVVSWDAYSLMGSVAAGAPISRWPGSGSSPVAMVGYGFNASAPTLQYENGVPHVRFSRNGRLNYGWFTAEANVTLPDTFSAGPAGLTIALVARMRTVVDGQQQGASAERIFEFSAVPGGSQNSLSISRDGSSNQIFAGYKNFGSSAWQFLTTNGINGSFQVMLIRFSTQPAAGFALYTQGAFRTLYTYSFEPIAFPKILAASGCFIGRPYNGANGDLHLTGEIQELSFYMGAFNDTMMAAEAARLTDKWAQGVWHMCAARGRVWAPSAVRPSAVRAQAWRVFCSASFHAHVLAHCR